jgi:uncharacterized protein (DUF342 family)
MADDGSEAQGGSEEAQGLDSLVLSEQGARIVAQVSAAESRVPIAPVAVRNLLDQAGYGAWMVLDDGIITLIDRWDNNPESFEIPIAEKRDASVVVGVAADSSVAWLQVSPARGGKSLQRADVASALQMAGVVFGIDEKAVLQACKATMPTKIEVAFQKPPVDGVDAEFKVLIETVATRVPQVNEQGLIDFRELGEIPFVQPGTPLMRRIPATQGVPGRNVRGHPVTATPGIDTPFADNLKGVRYSPNDPNVLEAEIKGQPVQVEHGMLVEDLLALDSVDMDSGNVSFDGSIQIKGDVMANMKVKVTGNIVIGGTVEGAELEAGGDIQVGRGIIAHAKVKAEGAVSARFVENSEVSAGTVISIDDMALQSELQALNQVIVGLKAQKRGRIVGGNTRSMMLVRAPQIGADDASGLTTVQVGVNPILEAKLQDVQAELVKAEAEQDNLKKAIQHLKVTGDKNNQLPRAQDSLQRALQNWALLLKEKNRLEEQLAMFQEARVEVTQGVEGSVALVFGKRSRRLQKAYDAGTFKLDPSGHILHTDARGVSTVVT